MNAFPEKNLIEEVATIKGINPSFVEKDWHVNQVIELISGISFRDFSIIFSGGTALSKAHKLIQRFQRI
jgi:predicted nucleotidyltransferase component of viral defense system